ncbi:hypothetical protein, partial [Mycobacterium tuberculosis]
MRKYGLKLGTLPESCTAAVEHSDRAGKIFFHHFNEQDRSQIAIDDAFLDSICDIWDLISIEVRWVIFQCKNTPSRSLSQ